MSDSSIQQLLYLMDEAFEGNDNHSLLANLRSVRDDDWRWLPANGGRAVFDIVQHVGESKYAYDNHAFGDRSMRWDRPGTLPSITADMAPAAIIEWLRDGQERLRASVAALADDAELLRPRPANWGQDYETRWLINVMIQHDLYHAGEINHLLALRHGTDRWPWDQS